MAFDREVQLARGLALEAGAVAADYRRRGIEAETKADESPVTAADRACERLIVDGIARAFPDDGVLGEEGANKETENGRRWIIDPIDGTRDYVRGIPLWAVLIGLEEHGQVVAAAAFSPGQNICLTATRGGGTWLEGKQMQVQDRSDPGSAVLSFNGLHKQGMQQLDDRLLPWLRRFWAVRSLGGSVDAMLLAQGQADMWIEPSAAPWDLAALQLIVQEAGGEFGSFSGGNTIYGGNAWACVPGLVPVVHDLLPFAI